MSLPTEHWRPVTVALVVGWIAVGLVALAHRGARCDEYGPLVVVLLVVYGVVSTGLVAISVERDRSLTGGIWRIRNAPAATAGIVGVGLAVFVILTNPDYYCPS